MWWVVASAVSYSMFTVFSKWALEDLRPTDVLFWRFAIAVPAALAIVMLRRQRIGAAATAAPARLFLVAGGVFGIVALLAFVALDHMSAALYTVIIYTYPAMVAAGSALLGRRPPNRTWIAIGVTVLGIAFTVPQVFDSPDADVLGLVFTLANALVYAGYVLGTGRLIGDERGAPIDGFAASMWSCTGSLLFATAVLPFTGLRVPPDLAGWLGLVGLGVVSTVLAGATLFLGLRVLPAATAALIATLEPVLTLVWAMLLLHESLAALQLLGATLVILGVVWSQRTNPVVAAEPG
ncbi:MAG: hypothetical protein JWN61_903 [Pseudonocardiales bacterium]|nr:hypothetical protein [Jatrophihabitantaceae bacterium]MCW2602768.1 hypothetical protein [Pseudonocardiales bacterium]